MTKTFVLNVRNLKTEEDAAKIEQHFMTLPGMEKIEIEMNLSIVSLYYNDAVGSPQKLLEAFDIIGYPVR